VLSHSGFQYYLIVLDDYSHYVWMFLLRHKSYVLPTLVSFHAFIQTQFGRPILAFQTDNGSEFDNKAFRSFLAARGIVSRLTCPYTSQQNGHAERILRTLNDSMRTMLLHAAMPLSFWPDALQTTSYLLNRRPCTPCSHATPFLLLFVHASEYEHLREFGCLCFPNTSLLHARCPASSSATPTTPRDTAASTQRRAAL